ncbi:hypothetical protein ACGFZQ_07525 [Streptomyces sp. NPDC048254]|uniref:hypothetical protein n=1 Tax=Streptomyces sp. NPDC048254 TaxID=3365525 RepID=UPI003718CE42
MTEPSPPRLADLCTELPQLKRTAARHGRHAQLRQFLQSLHDILDQADPADRTVALDEAVTRIWRAYGLPVAPRSWRPETQLPGRQAAAPVTGLYVCPRGHCGRAEKRSPGGPLPLCALHDNEPLTFEGQP